MKECLACGGTELESVLDLGEQPLANSFDVPDLYPLKLMACKDCYHGQLSVAVQPDTLYKNYYYVSGTSNTLKNWFSDFADRFGDGTGKHILDVASNDGSLLIEFKKRGWTCQGVDPAQNINTQGIDTLRAFFNDTTELPDTYDLITAFNVLAHGPNPLSLLKGIYKYLKDDGVAYVMTSQCTMFEKGQFDTIYHEHFSYFNLKSFQLLANRAGFTDIDYTIEPIHGGSFLFKLTKSSKRTSYPMVRPDFQGFVDKVSRVRPYKIVGYGAAAKAVVTINALEQQLDYIVDDAPMKIGKILQGTDIPIVSPDRIANDPDNLVVMIYAWNFYDEIVGRIKAIRPDRADVFVRYWT